MCVPCLVAIRFGGSTTKVQHFAVIVKTALSTSAQTIRLNAEPQGTQDIKSLHGLHF